MQLEGLRARTAAVMNSWNEQNGCRASTRRRSRVGRITGADTDAYCTTPSVTFLDAVHYASYLLPGDSTHPWGVSQDAAGRAMITGLAWNPTITSTTTGPQGTYAGGVTGLPNGMAVLMDLLPTGVDPIGASSPACAAAAYMQVNSQPNAGNAKFAFLCENAPANAFGACVFGTPVPSGIPLLGAVAHVTPSVSIVTFADAQGFASVPLPIPAGLNMPFGLAAQYAFLPSTSCGGNLVTASNALVF